MYCRENVKGATVVVSCTADLIVYPMLQKYFIKGVAIGAVKADCFPILCQNGTFLQSHLAKCQKGGTPMRKSIKTIALLLCLLMAVLPLGACAVWQWNDRPDR
jgi:hypothetical protein